jgi:hypothetical protein
MPTDPKQQRPSLSDGSDFPRGQRPTATPRKMMKIGFIGLGHMGGNMAALARCGVSGLR